MMTTVSKWLGREKSSTIPFDMFDRESTAREAKAAQKLERLYHKGQDKIWDGKDYLDELIEKHGGINIPEDQVDPVRRLFAVILWGELAAWKISAALALKLEPLGAKMAATSQAHDEARHFYVIHDYLAHVGEVPNSLLPATTKTLERVLKADHVSKMLLGMQLVVEPMALTLFQLIREKNIEPVLSDLLVRFEQDEARHVALGVLYLPKIMKGMTTLQMADLAQWQFREYMLQFSMLKELEEDFRALGVEPREVFELGRKKQLLATQMFADQVGRDLPITEMFLRFSDFRAELDFPLEDNGATLFERTKKAFEAGLAPRDRIQGRLTTVR
jgi:hypothetical protein